MMSACLKPSMAFKGPSSTSAVPMRALFDGAERVRQRLDVPGATFAYPLFDQLNAEGLTEYSALPMTFSNGKIHSATWTTDRPDGFDDAHVTEIEDLLPIFSLRLEIHINSLCCPASRPLMWVKRCSDVRWNDEAAHGLIVLTVGVPGER